MSSDAAAAIAANNQRFMDRFAQGDAPGIANLYTAEGQLLPPNSSPVTGQEAVAKFWSGAMGMGIKTVQLDSVETEIHGGSAVEIGHYALGGEGGQILDRGKYLVVWREEADGWKLHRDIWNTSMPPG